MCSHNISVDMVMQDEKTRIDTILREQYDILPTGTILMYNGSNWQNDSTIPGWYMCDGQNGTPDLRERFIAGCSYSTGRTIPNAPGKFGGENSFTLKTDNLPAHAYSIPAHNPSTVLSQNNSELFPVHTMPADSPAPDRSFLHHYARELR